MAAAEDEDESKEELVATVLALALEEPGAASARDRPPLERGRPREKEGPGREELEVLCWRRSPSSDIASGSRSGGVCVGFILCCCYGVVLKWDGLALVRRPLFTFAHFAESNMTRQLQAELSLQDKYLQYSTCHTPTSNARNSQMIISRQ